MTVTRKPGSINTQTFGFMTNGTRATDGITLFIGVISMNPFLDYFTDESARQVAATRAQTFQRMTLRCRANSSDQILTTQFRVNGVTGNLIITIPAGITAVFQDLDNSDTLANTDLFVYISNTPVGVGTTQIRAWQIEARN